MERLRSSHSCDADQDDDDEPGIAARLSDRRSVGVARDISELTKTFSRQLWGVASFLALPPHKQQYRTDREQICAAAGVSDVLRGSGSEMDSLSHSESSAPKVERREQFSPNEVFERHHQDSEGTSPKASRNAMENLFKPCLGSERRINGVGKDLAELRGSVTTSFSRIMNVMRDEIDGGRWSDVIDSDLGDEIDSRADVVDSEFEDEVYLHADEPDNRLYTPPRPQGATVLRPLSNNLLQDVSGTGLDGESSRDKNHGGLIIRLESREKDCDRGKKIKHGVGITEEVLTFARNISMHPETWLDFPLLSDDEDDDDYEMSDVQKEHVFQVELASPRLAALRIELCPDYMSAGCFWKIYFVLLHPRLTKKDAVLLSTPQIVEARALLLNKLLDRDMQVSKSALLENDSLNRRNKPQEGDLIAVSNSLPEKLSGMESFKIVSLQAATKVSSKDFDQIEDLPGAGDDRPRMSSRCADYGEKIENKNILASTVKLAALRYEEDEADADKWLEEDISPCVRTGIYLVNDEDVSFSDLEEDDDLPTSKFVEGSLLKSSCGPKNQTSQELEEFKLSKGMNLKLLRK